MPFFLYYEVEFSHINFLFYYADGESKKLEINLDIELKKTTLRLPSINITPEKSKEETSSAYVLKDYILNQFQSFSLSNVLQQIQGKIITSTKLNIPNILNLGSALGNNNNNNNNNNNAFGLGGVGRNANF